MSCIGSARNSLIAAVTALIGLAASGTHASDRTSTRSPGLNGDWVLPPADCYPNLDDFDYRYRIDDGPDTIIWWCDVPQGLQLNFRTGNYGNARDSKVLTAIRSGGDSFAIEQAAFQRTNTQQELDSIWDLQRRYQPRCFAESSAATAQVYSSTSDNKVGAPRIDKDLESMSIGRDGAVACGWRLAEEQRYCLVSNLSSVKNELLPLDSWVACRIERAPEEGWPDAQPSLADNRSAAIDAVH
jgi:hypothetical protein